MKKIFNVLLCITFACHSDMWVMDEACEQVYENNNFEVRTISSYDTNNLQMDNICIKICQDCLTMDDTEIEMWRDCFPEVDFGAMSCYAYKGMDLMDEWDLNTHEACEQVYENNNFDARSVPSCDADNSQFSNIEADQDSSSDIGSDNMTCGDSYSSSDLMYDEDSIKDISSDGACEQIQEDTSLEDIDYKIVNMEKGMYRLSDIDIKRIQYYKSIHNVPISNKLIKELTYQYNYAAINGPLYERNLFLYSYYDEFMADRYMFIDKEKEPFI